MSGLMGPIASALIKYIGWEMNAASAFDVAVCVHVFQLMLGV